MKIAVALYIGMIVILCAKAGVTLSSRINRVDDGQKASAIRKEIAQLSQQKMKLRAAVAQATSLSVVNQSENAYTYIGIQQPLALGGQSTLALAQ